MKNACLMITALLISFSSLSAQKEETLFNHSNSWFSGIWGSAIYDYNYFDSDWAMVKGGTFGLEFGKTVFLGYGNYRLKDDLRLPDNNEKFDLKYKGFLLGLTPNSYKAVHPKLSVFAGNGRVNLEDADSDRIFVVQPSAGIEVNVFQWFRLGLEGGYRFVTNTNSADYSNEDFSAPFAQLELKFGISWGGKNNRNHDNW